MNILKAQTLTGTHHGTRILRLEDVFQHNGYKTRAVIEHTFHEFPLVIGNELTEMLRDQLISF